MRGAQLVELEVPDPALVIDAVTKRFPGVTALDSVSFEVQRGACHALLGENGAGKSTLGKLIAGIYAPDSGRILMATRSGEPRAVCRFRSPLDAAVAGVRIVHQEPALCRNLSIGENLFLGNLPRRAGFVRHAEMRRVTTELLARVGLRRDPDTPVAALSTGEEQLLQIAAAVGSGARLMIFDEPTSSLSEPDAERLFAQIAELRGLGTTILYVSHRLAEIRRLCDFVTVLRDGRHVTTQPAAELTDDDFVRLMVGRSVEAYRAPERVAGPRDVLLEVDRVASPPRVREVSLQIRSGEIVGLAGLVGAGRSDLAAAIFGILRRARGTVRMRGRAVRERSPVDAIRAGVGLLPEDRQLQGLVLAMTCQENLTLATLPRLTRWGLLRHGRERALAAEYFQQFRVRTPGADAPVAGLSGGNQQKIALAKWLACACEVLILDEPTRGVDVGAKAELHAWIGRLAAEGRGVLLITSDLPELLSLSSRVLVMRAGRLVGELSGDEASPERVLRLMAGVEGLAQV